MQYQCSQCHHTFTSEGRAEHCPNCKAEAGLEAHEGVPALPMRLFGLLLALVILTAVGGGVDSRIVG